MKLEDLKEARVGRHDPAMDDYYDTKHTEDTNRAEGPYYVGWEGQGHEWYSADGDSEPETGKGRYKQKHGGGIVAINVPDYETAQQIANDLDMKYEEHKFPDKFVYGEWGKDWYVEDYYGAFVRSMKDMDEMDRWEAEHNQKRIKNYAQK